MKTPTKSLQGLFYETVRTVQMVSRIRVNFENRQKKTFNNSYSGSVLKENKFSLANSSNIITESP